jgi:hypothetical protein
VEGVAVFGQGRPPGEGFSLVKKRERSTKGFCERPSRGFRWVFPDGEIGLVRCGASNRCSYCAMLSALENALVVRLDCLEGERWPSWGLTTTTRRPGFAQAELRRAEQNLFRQLRRDQPGESIEYLGFVEFTRGLSDGVRRPHVHHLVKGLGRPSSERVKALEARVSELWHRYTGDAWVVECRPLRTPTGAIAYLALHHHKAEQAPPKGWSGKRFRPSKGYFSRPVGELRAEARALLQDQRIERALMEHFDLPDVLPGEYLDDLILDNIDWARAEVAKSAPAFVSIRELAIAGVPRDATVMPAKLSEVVRSNVNRRDRVQNVLDEMASREDAVMAELYSMTDPT